MKQVFIKTYGCSLNQSDSELMAGLIEESEKYHLCDSIEMSDVVIINSCTVKQTSEKNLFRDLKEINKLIILGGCVPQADMEKDKYENYSVIGTSNLNKIVEVLDETFVGNIVHYFKRSKDKRLNLPKIRRNKIIEIIPVSEGCLGNCTYCKVRQARGKLVSYDRTEIIKQAETAIKEGVKEIWLTSQDMGCYGHDNGTNLIELLKRLLLIKGKFYVRIGMANPNFVYPMIDEIIDILKHPNMFKFLHIPVQSGSDAVLQSMNRKYTTKEYYDIVNKIKASIPEITISTDIIVGYPGESDEDFQSTLRLIKDTKPSVLNISRFFPRPNTPAAKLRQLTGGVIKDRSRELTKLFLDISKKENKRWLDWEGEILIDEKGKSNTMIGRNYCYKPVIISGRSDVGTTEIVHVKSVTSHDLRANF